MSEKLYNFLSQQGDYTKSYEDFQTQFANEKSQENLYNFMKEKGDYTKSSQEFENQFFSKKCSTTGGCPCGGDRYGIRLFGYFIGITRD